MTTKFKGGYGLSGRTTSGVTFFVATLILLSLKMHLISASIATSTKVDLTSLKFSFDFF